MVGPPRRPDADGLSVFSTLLPGPGAVKAAFVPPWTRWLRFRPHADAITCGRRRRHCRMRADAPRTGAKGEQVAALDSAGTAGNLEGVAKRRMVRRAIIASATGTTIEWYDFFLYGVAAALVFPAKFFPNSDPFTGTLLAFSTYFVGFVARPVGAALFGHYGDRIGRKTALIATLLLMGGATDGHRPRARLRPDRHLGRGAPDLLPHRPGHRRGRRMGRCRADGRRVDRPEAARASRPASRSSARRPAWCWPTARCRSCRSSPARRTSSTGAGASRSCSARPWCSWACTSGPACGETPVFAKLQEAGTRREGAGAAGGQGALARAGADGAPAQRPADARSTSSPPTS